MTDGRANRYGLRMTDTTPVSPNDPDVRLLLDLIDLLDVSLLVNYEDGDTSSLWDAYARAHHGVWNGHYYVSSLIPFYRRLSQGEGDQEDVRRLAEYCLTFFSVADNPELCGILEGGVGDIPPNPAGTAGRRWAQSICEVAWRLYVPREAAMLRSERDAERRATRH